MTVWPFAFVLRDGTVEENPPSILRLINERWSRGISIIRPSVAINIACACTRSIPLKWRAAWEKWEFMSNTALHPIIRRCPRYKHLCPLCSCSDSLTSGQLWRSVCFSSVSGDLKFTYLFMLAVGMRITKTQKFHVNLALYLTSKRTPPCSIWHYIFMKSRTCIINLHWKSTLGDIYEISRRKKSVGEKKNKKILRVSVPDRVRCVGDAIICWLSAVYRSNRMSDADIIMCGTMIERFISPRRREKEAWRNLFKQISLSQAATKKGGVY